MSETTQEAATVEETLQEMFGEDDYFEDDGFDEELDALVEEMEAEAAEAEEEVTEEDVEAAVNAAEIEDSIKASYEEEGEAESTGEVETKKVKRRKRLDTSGMSFSEIVNAKLPDLANQLILDDDAVTLSEEERQNIVQDLVERIDSLPKKVSEKAVNAFQAATSDIKLSVYTQQAINLLYFLAVKALNLLMLLIIQHGLVQPFLFG